MHRSLSLLRQTLPLLLLLFSVCGFSSAYSQMIPLPASVPDTAVQVNRCHLTLPAKHIPPCCQSEACHRSTPAHRDLGSPHFQKPLHPGFALTHDAWSFKLLAGTQETLVTVAYTPWQAKIERSDLLPPRQSHSQLRSVILLH